MMKLTLLFLVVVNVISENIKEMEMTGFDLHNIILKMMFPLEEMNFLVDYVIRYKENG